MQFTPHRTSIRSSFLAALPLVLLAGTAAEWNQWRGPNRDGKSQESGLLKEWPANGPERAWEVDSLGAGYSSLAASRGVLYSQGAENGRQFLIALDAATGRTKWKRFHGKLYSNGRGDGPRGTPTVNGNRVYALGADGNLICAESSSGATVWEKNLLRTYGGSNIRWGISESPLVDGQRVIVNAGGRGASIVALNASTGAELWKTQSDEAGYSSAMAADLDGVRQYIVLTGEGAVGVLAENGELLWRYRQVSNSTANIATPARAQCRHPRSISAGIFLSTAYGTGCALLRLGMQASEVYFSTGYEEPLQHLGAGRRLLRLGNGAGSMQASEQPGYEEPLQHLGAGRRLQSHLPSRKPRLPAPPVAAFASVWLLGQHPDRNELCHGRGGVAKPICRQGASHSR